MFDRTSILLFKTLNANFKSEYEQHGLTRYWWRFSASTFFFHSAWQMEVLKTSERPWSKSSLDRLFNSAILRTFANIKRVVELRSAT